MGFFFSGPDNRIKFKDLDKHLKNMNFSYDERKALSSLFEQHKETGISKDHVKNVIKELETNYSDRFTRFHSQKLKEGLFERFDKPTSKPEIKGLKPTDSTRESGKITPKILPNSDIPNFADKNLPKTLK